MSQQKNTTSTPTNQAQVHVGKVADNCCDDHLDEEVRFYCTDCTVLICDECVQSIHKTHDFKSFKKVVKEYMDTNGKNVDELCSINLSEKSVKGIKPTEAELKEEITRVKAQAEKLVNKINQIRDQKEQEIQNMIEKNKIAVQQIFLFVEERFVEPARKLKQLVSEPGRANDREAVRIIMRLKDMNKSLCDKRIEHTVFTPKFVATEIDENVLEKLFGELEIKKKKHERETQG
jgi:hypothetical protein